MHNQSIFLCKTEAKSMKTSDFYYELPQELIAQTPAEPRDHSRLMCVDRKTGAVAHRHFYDIVDLLEAGDLFGRQRLQGAACQTLWNQRGHRRLR